MKAIKRLLFDFRNHALNLPNMELSYKR